MEAKNVFEEKIRYFGGIYNALSKKSNIVSITRMAFFLIFIVMATVFANSRWGTALAVLLIIFPIVFGLLVRYHNRLSSRRGMARSISDINQEEINRLEHKLKALDEGQEFFNKAHPYLHDLDIFGRNSVFQLVSRAVTPTGRTTLAAWLKTPASRERIVRRQTAIQELNPMIDWRQEFQASGSLKRSDKSNINQLITWINQTNSVLGIRKYRIMRYVLPLFTLGLIYLNIEAELSIYWTLVALVINGFILKKFAMYAEEITDKTFKSLTTLKAYGQMIRCIESQEFHSEYLQELQKVFIYHDQKASASILQLQKILDYLQARSNMFYMFLNVILLLDLHLVVKAEKWKKDQKGDVNLWFKNIGKFEAVSSFAAFAFANPNCVFPTISEELYTFEARSLAHPLIPAMERVANDISVCGKNKILVITGSNMSGKSTFLRTVGVNIVLALAGSPVCAQEMKVSEMQLFTSMRTEDNLEQHISSFYAELKRIKALLDMLEESNLPVMFMLDEILKGTNSKDRHEGAKALIKQLSEAPAMGFVSTHDLELGGLSDELPNVSNYSFNSVIDGNEIIFNYKLEKGVCHSFNASKLMEKIGIKL